MQPLQQRRLIITGAGGLLGFHLRALLHGSPEFEVRPIDRRRFHRPGALSRSLRNADVVVHLAGMNRGPADELEQTNVALANKLLAELDAGGTVPHVVFASSTHRDHDSAYGRSKRIVEEMFSTWSATRGGHYSELVLPNVFGEYGRPHHNSVVATFCHRLAVGDRPELILDQEITLVHAQRVARLIRDIISRKVGGRCDVPGTPILVSELLAVLEKIDACYRDRRLPDTRASFDRDMFNTYRSYIPLDHFPIPLDAYEDQRGRLIEAVQTLGRGQCFYSTTAPGATRGGHFHRHKFERFLVVDGYARIRLRRLFSAQLTECVLRGEEPAVVDIPTFCTHDLTNIGEGTLVTLFWADEVFDPAEADTQMEPMEP